MHLLSLVLSLLLPMATRILCFCVSDGEAVYVWRRNSQPLSSWAPTEYMVSVRSAGRLRATRGTQDRVHTHTHTPCKTRHANWSGVKKVRRVREKGNGSYVTKQA